MRKENLKLTLLEGSLKIEATRHDQIPENWKTPRAAKSIHRYALELRLTRLRGLEGAMGRGSLILRDQGQKVGTTEFS